MQIISKANKSMLMLLKQFCMSGQSFCWSQYCVHNVVSDGVLVFNLMTRELVLLTLEEYAKYNELDYLRDHWFVIPENINAKEIADFVKQTLTACQPKPKEITDYIIYTTTDCNARCFYCFERGRSRIPMSCETAEKVVQYIKNHCGSKDVSICWLGGEPLFNVDVIDIIADGLRREGINFSSRMISNGYLFDDVLVSRAQNSWNLKKIQITLDGTEKIYNKIKSYIYRNTNPFEIVMNNIDRLLYADIRVSIRLTMDLYNAEDLQALAAELAMRFAGKSNVSVYAYHLFKGDTANVDLHSEEEWEKRIKAMDLLNEILEKNDLRSKVGIPKKIRFNHCMADSGKSVTILPDGNLGLCDQCTDSEFFGHLDSNDVDEAVIKSWSERMPEIPECAECFFFIDCVRLKKCSTSSICYHQFQLEKLKSTKRAMLCEYERWLTASNTAEDDDSVFC